MWCSSTTLHLGTILCSASSSFPLRGGTPPRQGTHFLSASCSVMKDSGAHCNGSREGLRLACLTAQGCKQALLFHLSKGKLDGGLLRGCDEDLFEGAKTALIVRACELAAGYSFRV